MNVYQPEIHRNLPRLLALFVFDCTAYSFGLGDRFHWGWGLIDFGNGTSQGAGKGLARLVAHDMLPHEIDADRVASIATKPGTIKED